MKGVVVAGDFREVTRDISRSRGSGYRFTFGDYIARCMTGAFDPSVYAIDLPEGASIYHNGNTGACVVS